jgi:hypothetical protein
MLLLLGCYDVNMNGEMKSCPTSTALIAAKLGGHEIYIELMLLRSRAVLQLVFEADLSQHAAETEVLPDFHGSDRCKTWWR